MEKVIPQGLNYGAIKPEAIENKVYLIRFTPTANVQESQPNDVIRFNISGNGFFDPYSSYIRITVEIPNGVGSSLNGKSGAKILDRSAHSLINRMVIRSYGTEIERIEYYDVLAAMINDIIYSREYKILHHYEGFPYQHPAEAQVSANIASSSFVELRYTYGTYGECIGEWAVPYSEEAKITYAAGSLWENGSRGGELAEYKTAKYNTMTFCIPIYSGILGVLMPDKKLLPLSLMPLEVEFTLNPHAFYCVGDNIDRNYLVKRFEIYAHMLFFEYEVHRSLEDVVAEHGIFIHFNSFYLAPVSVNSGGAESALTQYSYINVYFKSINSIHWVYMYSGFETNPRQRKLYFVSHRLYYAQIRNGTDLIPSEPIIGDAGAVNTGNYVQFLIEMYKSWNKMHDPNTDGAITPVSFTRDSLLPNAPAVDLSSLAKLRAAMVVQQMGIPRCQYGISLEGEELGQDKTTITGRKGMMPFDINANGIKTLGNVSYVLPFVRSDMVVYVRPDLVVSVLGR